MKSHILLASVALAGAVVLVGCSNKPQSESSLGGENTNDIVAEVGDTPQREQLEQGWSDEIREAFWFTSQGSRIMPYNWFTWLEQHDSQQLFRDSKHMEGLRYLPSKASALNPSGLPIGFVKDIDKTTQQSYVGMTCAACHTNQLDYKGKKYLIEGAPTLANFVLFFDRLVASINKTANDTRKFERFAQRVLQDDYSADTANTLKAQLKALAIAVTNRQKVNALPSHFPKDFTSYARLDAFGNIQNEGTAFALHDLQNRNTPSGPVSYPFLWGTHQSDVVQWNASAPNTPIVGPLARNMGEVVGVFGGLTMTPSPWYARLFGLDVQYRSSVDMVGTGHLESWVKTLKSPRWPENDFPPIQTELVKTGEQHFKENCVSCHQIIAREDEFKRYKAVQTPAADVGTDPVTTWNASRHMAQTLLLEGTRKSVIFGPKFEAETAAISIPVNGVVGLILEDPDKALKAGLIPFKTKAKNASTDTKSGEAPLGNPHSSESNSSDRSLEDLVLEHVKKRSEINQKQQLNKVRKDYSDLDGLVYKARPLNGIWATAPYLHNGSVPNLWQLLQAPEKRIKQFMVGSREFDPVNVGYITTRGLNEFNVLADNQQIMPGNSNLGHDYGTRLTDQEKWALIEFMKTL